MSSILVIDDDQQVCTFIRSALERRGHTVGEAPDGAKGLCLFGAGRPDLVICDLLMDNKDGLETIQELRRLNPIVKLIALSGDARLLSVARALGADATLSKPVSCDALLLCVDEVLARPGA